jgi:hypothetical protein
MVCWISLKYRWSFSLRHRILLDTAYNVHIVHEFEFIVSCMYPAIITFIWMMDRKLHSQFGTNFCQPLYVQKKSEKVQHKFDKLVKNLKIDD